MNWRGRSGSAPARLRHGLIDDPRRCRFDPKVLECKNGDGSTCLTPAQVEPARRIYSPAVNPKTKQEIFPALQPGSELGWGGLAGPQPVGEAVEFFQYSSSTIRPGTSGRSLGIRLRPPQTKPPPTC